MLVDFRAHERLRGEDPVHPADLIAPVVTALSEDPATDLARVRVVCDWVQYRSCFRDVVEVRPILPGPRHLPGAEPVVTPVTIRADDVEIAVDTRRGREADLRHLTAERLRAARDGTVEHVLLEDWGRGSASCVWGFNARYWADLDLWERATGRGYEQALPGGESDATNGAAARQVIGELFEAWDALDAKGALPEELYVVEFGVGNGSQARVFLDEFLAFDTARGGRYYRRLHYLMCDYSPHVLELSRVEVAAHAARVSSFALDATRPLTALSFLQYKVFLVYISNVYDNLPTDEVAQMGGRAYTVETRAYLPLAAARGIADRLGIEAAMLPALVHKLLRLGPTLLAEAAPAVFASVDEAVAFWRDAWEAVRLEERYAPLAGLDLYEVAPGLSGEWLRPLLESGADVRMHVSNGAAASFVDSIRLLHPFGTLVCHDLFTTEVDAYRGAFRGPGKYDGSVVNWVNGPLLAHVGRRHGYSVHYEPFRHRPGNITTMIVQARD